MSTGIIINSPEKNMFIMNELNKINTPRVLFYENMCKFQNVYHYPILPVAEAYGFKGNLIATTMSTAAKLANMPCMGEKIFYVRSLEWTHLQQKTYEQLYNIYKYPFRFIAAAEPIAKYLDVCWDIKAEILPELKFGELCA